jgi:hypothetical protein
MQKAKYRNPWYKSDQGHYGPRYFETDAKPVEHAGHLIYQRVPGQVWDVVKDGVCLTQLAGPNGAKEAAEKLRDGTYLYGKRV